MKHRITLQDYARLRKINEQPRRGFSDLQREVKSKLGMNQASTIWDTMKYMKNKPNNKVLPMRKQFYVREV
jgi:hypothetical protein|tara:strand:+ start:120 stop:332 length:213 start_codon:yes stop_codon:yes gene_type:complete